MTEAIRYLDVHLNLPEGTEENLDKDYKAILASLLLNSSMAALKDPNPSYTLVDAYTTRVLGNSQLSDKDKGAYRSSLVSSLCN